MLGHKIIWEGSNHYPILLHTSYRDEDNMEGDKVSNYETFLGEGGRL